MRIGHFAVLALPLALAAPAFAAVDLVTVPTREGTQLTIYNSEDITMVREHRLLTVKEGVNRIQFSWANTLIDPTCIEFRILDQQDKVDLVGHDLPRRSQRRPAMEHQEPDRRQDPRRDPVLYLAASPGPPITSASPTRTRRNST